MCVFEGWNACVQHLHLLSVSKSVDSSAPLAMHIKNVHHISQNNAGARCNIHPAASVAAVEAGAAAD